MTSGRIAGGAFAAALVVLAVVVSFRGIEQGLEPSVTTSAVTRSTEGFDASLLYGRVTSASGTVYEGRLRWGSDEEALWGHSFNGFKEDNPWAAHVPPEQLPTERISIGILGIEFAGWERELDLGRPFMARLGDIVRIERRGREILVTLKSGSVFVLDRLASDDLADGLRVWDRTAGVVDLAEQHIRTLELLPVPQPGTGSYPLHGTAHTLDGDFTGLIQWNRAESINSDELDGLTADSAISLRFDTIRSIERLGRDSSLVTLLDGGEIPLSGTREVGRGHRGVYVDDQRYGRVLISWNALERVDFSPGGTGPGYRDFPPGHPLTGSVTTRSGGRLVGRLVFDLDESETTETLDAPRQGVDYTVLFGLIASIVPPRLEEPSAEPTRVTLHSGEELHLGGAGDLGEGNAGMLIFVDEAERPEYVPWGDVERVDLDRPPEMYPPGEAR